MLTSVSRQPRRQLKQRAIRNGILIIIPRVRQENLPPQPTGTRIRIPAIHLIIEHRPRQPRPTHTLLPRRIRKLQLSSTHGRKSPEGLVVVAHLLGGVFGHVVAVGADLEHHGVHDHVVVLGVTRVGIVFDQFAPECAGLPPVVGFWENPWGAARLSAGVVCEDIFYYCVGNTFDRVWLGISRLFDRCRLNLPARSTSSSIDRTLGMSDRSAKGRSSRLGSTILPS